MRTLEDGSVAAVAPAPGRPIRVVAAGGGTGLPRVLAGLAAGVEPEEDRAVELTAVVTTADDGGSSGALRRAYGVPAAGDVRNCLVALAAGANPLAAVFQHRFDGGDPALAGHSVGNLVLTALAQRLGGFSEAVAAAGALLGVRGRVLPATEGPVDLVARLDDGRMVRGESRIARARARVAELRLARPAPAPREAIEAVLAADVVVLGPGSLYSSVIASLVGRGMPEALRATSATRVLVVNLVTQPGETHGYTAADHVRAVREHLGDVVDVALVHRGPLPAAVLAAHAAEGAAPVEVDRAELEALGAVPVVLDLLAAGAASAPAPLRGAEVIRGQARHDPDKLARALLAIARAR